ncbi:bacteriohemerythrin [Geomonas sp. RF6]|uniref:bacteriohemerythrin n=1 Tax=Geomonas sp. RF6 TaxID=2897342 RepID=UPI001E36F872|nr:bacteriohemerythrin [Geomonas sp. RF6]UFS72203.1 bacteriohemerythrin [Geomonas sp. RF6]
MSQTTRAFALNAAIVTSTVAILTTCNRSGSITVALFLWVAILAISSFACWVLSRKSDASLKEVTIALEKVAQGDLSLRVKEEGTGDIARLGKAFNLMLGDWNRMMHKFFSVTDLVRDSVVLVKATTEATMAAAEDVAMQASTIATASEEMSATSSDIARSCLHAAENAQIATDETTRGADIVRNSSVLMESISQRVTDTSQTVAGLGKRSDQIGAIAGTIEDIADQTNLLALNAAIEAARAGEMGRGFAVVADEVRALAERTTKATKEIDGMIRSIQQETQAAVGSMSEGVEQVNKGTAETRRSGEALAGILGQINDLTMQVSQIATAAEEQTATTHEITNNIQMITSVVNSNVVSARGTSDATSRLAQQVDELHELVGHFRLSELLVWDASFSTSIALFDGHHKKLFEMINELSKAMQEKKTKEIIGSILKRLVEYTGSHFAAEEEAFRKTGYPDAEKHCQLHADLVRQVLDLQEKFESGTVVLTAEVTDFLQDWLVNHIKGTDRSYSAHLRKHGVK